MIAEIPLVVWVILWMISGAAGFVYWWTKRFDLTIGEIPLIIETSLIGPLSWIVGMIVHGRNTASKRRSLPQGRTGKEWYPMTEVQKEEKS